MDMLGSGVADGNFTEVDNLTLTCAARYIQGPVVLPYSSALTTTVRVIQSIYFIVVMFAGTFLNTLVIALVAKYKKLQTLFFLVSLQVVVLDLFLSVLILTTPITSIAKKWLFGEYVCAITGLLLSITTLTRTLLMFVFVIDRYLAVFWPYFYPKYKLKVIVTLSVAAWVLCTLLSIAMLPGLLDCYRFSSTGMVCVVSSRCNNYCSIYARTYSIVILAPATILPVLFYAGLYHKAKKIRIEMTSHTDTTGANKIRNEWKATITFSLLFVTLFVLILPVAVVSIVIIAISSGGELSPVAYTVLVANSGLILLLVITDPIVIMRNPDMKEVLFEIKAAAIQKWCPKEQICPDGNYESPTSRFTDTYELPHFNETLCFNEIDEGTAFNVATFRSNEETEEAISRSNVNDEETSCENAHTYENEGALSCSHGSAEDEEDVMSHSKENNEASHCDENDENDEACL